MMTMRMMSNLCHHCGQDYFKHKAFTCHCPEGLKSRIGHTRFHPTNTYNSWSPLSYGGLPVSNPFYPKGKNVKPVINVVIPCASAKEAEALLKKIKQLSADDSEEDTDEGEEDEKPAKKAKKPAKDEDDSDDDADDEDDKPAKKKAKKDEDEDEPADDDEVAIEVGMKVTVTIDGEKTKGCKITKVDEENGKVTVKTPDGDVHKVKVDALSL